MEDFLVRPARPEDREPVLKFCEKTWGEHGDYIADVWDSWMADRQGAFLVGELAGRPVAIGKITLLSPGEAWLEGMRVAPEYRRHGIATAFIRGQRSYLRSMNPRVIRLATGARNVAIHHIMFRRGYQHVATFVLVKAEADETLRVPLPYTFRQTDMPSLVTFLEQSKIFAMGHRLYAHGWQWPELTPARLNDLLQAKEVVGYRTDDGAVAAMAILPPPFEESDGLWVGWLDGKQDQLIRLAKALRRQAAATPDREVAGFVPAESSLPTALAQAGYRVEPDMKFWILEWRNSLAQMT